MYDNLNEFSNLRFQTEFQQLASPSANSKSLKSIYNTEWIVSDGPSISPPLIQPGPLAGEEEEEGGEGGARRSVIQLPLYKFYYMVQGYGCESAVSNEELVVPDSLLGVSVAAIRAEEWGVGGCAKCA